ncbi:right-handed parallel beta-helix repeat-containing protein [Butyrivibrio sp. JL13D10]|uniref:right-handed parallel beta-helix repeat-containing protein n=1 Tax=Butyrivibrio sp. JL13D10 TaxID=3236815 RepID=UPI0038B5FA3F
MKRFAKILSLAIAGTMFFSTSAISSLAKEPAPALLNSDAGDAASFISAVENGEDVTLTKSISINGCSLKNNNQTIDLGGNTVTGTSGAMFFSADSSAAGGYDVYHDITIKNGTIQRSTDSTHGLVIIGHTTNVTFENVTFIGGKDGHMLEFGACKNIIVKNCTFKDGRYSNSDDKGEYEALTFDAAHTGNFPILPSDDTACEDVIIDSCTFSNVRRAIGAHRIIKGHLFDNITIVNCKFNNITGTAIEAVGFTNAKIEDNTFSKVQFGIDCKPSSKNIISNPGAYDSHNVISNNTIELVQSNSKTPCGVRISGTDKSNKIGDFTVSKITVTGPHAYAVYAGDVTNSTISDVTSSGASINGIRVERSSGVTVFANNISKTKSHGIMLLSSSDDFVEGNTISNAKTHGIALESSTNETIIGNTITKPKKQGINLNKKSTCTLVAENKIVKAKYGINCEDKKSKIFSTYANNIKKSKGSAYSGKGTYFAADNAVISLKKGKGEKITTVGKSGSAKYSSEDKKIATVDKSGKINAKSKGTTTIIAKKGKYYAKIKVTVK